MKFAKELCGKKRETMGFEFAYNRSMHRTVGKSPFEVVYGLQPIGPMELAPHPTIQQFS